MPEIVTVSRLDLLGNTLDTLWHGPRGRWRRRVQKRRAGSVVPVKESSRSLRERISGAESTPTVDWQN